MEPRNLTASERIRNARAIRLAQQQKRQRANDRREIERMMRNNRMQGV